MDDYETIFREALSIHQAGRLPEAERLYRQVLSHNPHHADALHLLGLIAYQSGNGAAAIPLIQQALAISNDHPIYLSNLGASFLACGRTEEAIAACRQAVMLAPSDTAAGYNFGRALETSGDLEAAEQQYRQVIQLQPGHAQGQLNLGNLLSNRRDMPGAIQHFRAALISNPDYAEAHYNLGNALFTTGEVDLAIDHFQRTIALKPDFAEAHNNLGSIYRSRDQMDRALECFTTAIQMKSDYPIAHNNTASVLQSLGRLDEALVEYRLALWSNPADAATHSNMLVAENYVPDNSPGQLLKLHRDWATRHTSVNVKQSYRQSIDPQRKLRIGYTSADFLLHPVAYFLLPLLSQHDRRAFEITCYNDAARSDRTTMQLQSFTDRWRDVCGWSDDHFEATIEADEIDILVDLAGHTAGNRLRVFARKPAPVQVSFLGYPNTTGLGTIDYRLTDEILDPPGEPSFFTEALMRLSGPFCSYAPPEGAPDVGPLPAEKRGQLTFGSLHTLAKLNSRVIETWCRILKLSPNSRLMIARSTLTESSHRRLTAEFAARGIPPERLEMRQLSTIWSECMQIYNEIDIVLDAFPWNGHTTTLEALWMGVPVVSLRGNRHAARMGAGLLIPMGLMELLGESEDAYVDCALALAYDTSRLRDLRVSLRDRVRKSPICDAASYAASVETAYRAMWRHWCGVPHETNRLNRAS